MLSNTFTSADPADSNTGFDDGIASGDSDPFEFDRCGSCRSCAFCCFWEGDADGKGDSDGMGGEDVTAGDGAGEAALCDPSPSPEPPAAEPPAAGASDTGNPGTGTAPLPATRSTHADPPFGQTGFAGTFARRDSVAGFAPGAGVTTGRPSTLRSGCPCSCAAALACVTSPSGTPIPDTNTPSATSPATHDREKRPGIRLDDNFRARETGTPNSSAGMRSTRHDTVPLTRIKQA
ncbi:hypothetical protein ACFHYQ_12240 [Sphaerimonospora cavernae]|uniref:4Fe-4S ferredoxin-type domain-containing protein n=1 Tax=Sphaerimonospora cavernae TaxID=1740611 RepID=A0ABV6U3N8_9ACTN